MQDSLQDQEFLTTQQDILTVISGFHCTLLRSGCLTELPNRSVNHPMIHSAISLCLQHPQVVLESDEGVHGVPVG